jgi:hypothetical protein
VAVRAGGREGGRTGSFGRAGGRGRSGGRAWGGREYGGRSGRRAGGRTGVVQAGGRAAGWWTAVVRAGGRARGRTGVLRAGKRRRAGGRGSFGRAPGRRAVDRADVRADGGSLGRSAAGGRPVGDRLVMRAGGKVAAGQDRSTFQVVGALLFAECRRVPPIPLNFRKVVVPILFDGLCLFRWSYIPPVPESVIRPFRNGYALFWWGYIGPLPMVCALFPRIIVFTCLWIIVFTCLCRRATPRRAAANE